MQYSITCLFLLCLHPLALAGAADYCVVSLVDPDDPYHAAEADELVVRVDVNGPLWHFF